MTLAPSYTYPDQVPVALRQQGYAVLSTLGTCELLNTATSHLARLGETWSDLPADAHTATVSIWSQYSWSIVRVSKEVKRACLKRTGRVASASHCRNLGPWQYQTTPESYTSRRRSNPY